MDVERKRRFDYNESVSPESQLFEKTFRQGAATRLSGRLSSRQQDPFEQAEIADGHSLRSAEASGFRERCRVPGQSDLPAPFPSPASPSRWSSRSPPSCRQQLSEICGVERTRLLTRRQSYWVISRCTAAKVVTVPAVPTRRQAGFHAVPSPGRRRRDRLEASAESHRSLLPFRDRESIFRSERTTPRG